MNPHGDKKARADAAPSAATRLARAPYTKGLHELSLFPDEASRNQAIAAIERRMNPRSLGDWMKFLLAIILFLAGPLTVGIIVARVFMPPMGPWNGRVTIAILLVGYTLIVALAIRRDMPRSLRKQLLEIGVPICLPCGYDLRTLPSDTAVCPECGRNLDPRAIAALNAPRP